MGFRRNRNKVEYVLWRGEEVHPAAGHFTVYYWDKGSPQNPKQPHDADVWVRADIYGPDGNLFQAGLLAGNLEQLKKLVAEEIQQFEAT